MYREELDHNIKEWIHNTTQKDITFQEAYIELPIEYQINNPKRINYLNLIWLREKMFKEAIEETKKKHKETIEEIRKNMLRQYPEPILIQTPENILINMGDIIQEDKDKLYKEGMYDINTGELNL